MRQVMVIVPALFLIALVALAFVMFKRTEANTPCTGEECSVLTADQLADMAIEASTR